MMVSSEQNNRIQFADLGRRLAVVTSVTPWREPPRMRHQVTRQLTRFYNVLYVESPLAETAIEDEMELVHGRLVRLRKSRFSTLFARAWHYCPPFVSWCNRRLIRAVHSGITQLGYNTGSLVNFDCNLPELMCANWLQGKIYIANDAWGAWPTPNWRARWCNGRLQERERRTAARADICLTVSTPLVRKLEHWAGRVELFLPGHEFPIASLAKRGPFPDCRERAITACFMGFMTELLRWDWLKEALRHTDIKLMLIGPVQAWQEVERLGNCSNLSALPPAEGTELKALIDSADVCLMPYNAELEWVRMATAPNKTFQYLACGKPIVISDMPHFLALPPGFLYRAKDAPGFVDAIRRAYAEDSDALCQRRLQIARENTWDARGDQLHSWLESLKRKPNAHS